MFKALERADTGKIELDMQQVGKTMTKAAGLSALVVETACCIMLFPLPVAVPGHLLTLETRQARALLGYLLEE